MNDRSLYMYSMTPEPDFEHPSQKTQRSLVAIKKDRRQLDSNAQALANRINLLQKEEAKIWSNLEKAKLKAKEAYFMKRRDQLKVQERLSQFQQNQNQYIIQNSNSANIRRQRESGIQLLKEAMKQQKHKEVLAAKRQSDIIMIKKRDLESQVVQENQKKMLAIKKEEILATFKKKAYFEDKIKRLKHNHVREIEEEEEQKVLKELEILDMEKKEMELVQRIQKTRVLQKQVYKDLESLFSEPQEQSIDGYYHPRASLPLNQMNQINQNQEYRGVRGKSVDGRIYYPSMQAYEMRGESPIPIPPQQLHRQNMNRLHQLI